MSSTFAATPQFRRRRLKALAVAAADHAPWLVDLYRGLAHPSWEAAIWQDFLTTHRALGWMRALPDPPEEAPRVLVVLRREDVFDVKSSLMQGAAMKLQGVRPVVLAQHRRVPRIHRYARAFGVSDLRFRSEVRASTAALCEIGKRVDELMARPDDFAATRSWTYGGFPLGERVLSTLIRETFDGDPDLERPDHRSRLERILRLALTHYVQAETILDSVEPRWVLADETGYAVNGPLVDVALARGLDVIETSPYLREGALIFKRMNGSVGRTVSTSVARETLEFLERRPWTADREAELQAELVGRYAGSTALQRMYQWNTQDLGREEICAEHSLDPERPLVVVFSHVLWDASFFYGEDLFANYGEWLERTVAAAAASPQANWLIKAHPANAFRLSHGDVSGPVAEVEVVRRRMQRLPDHVKLLLPETPVSSLALYRHADAGVTVRGTAGLEMACFGKPVITAGSGHYSGLGFTIDSATTEEYLARLDHIERFTEPLPEVARVRARRYAYTLFKLRPWVGRSFEVVLDYPEQGWHPLDRNVIARARSLEEAQRHGDLDRWADWSVNQRTADYLEDFEKGGAGTCSAAARGEAR